MKNKHKILILIGVALFAAVVFWVISTTPTEPPPPEKFNPPAKMTYENNTILEEKNGEKFLELNAGKMIVDAKTQDTDLEDIHVKLYQENGKVVELKALRGNYNNKSGNIHVEGDVVVFDSDGAKLTSDKLDWNGKKEILTATDKVKISKDDMRAYGDRAEAKNGLRHFKLKGHARILRGVKESEGN